MKASRRQSNNVLEPQADAPIVGTPAMVRKATGDTANRVEPLAIRPTHEDIARRAYQIYEARGGEHGQDWQDWFEAERELRQFLHDVVRNILTAEGVYAAA